MEISNKKQVKEMYIGFFNDNLNVNKIIEIGGILFNKIRIKDFANFEEVYRNSPIVQGFEVTITASLDMTMDDVTKLVDKKLLIIIKDEIGKFFFIGCDDGVEIFDAKCSNTNCIIKFKTWGNKKAAEIDQHQIHISEKNLKVFSTEEYKNMNVEQIMELVDDYLASPYDKKKFSNVMNSIIDFTERPNDKSGRKIITNALIKIKQMFKKMKS